MKKIYSFLLAVLCLSQLMAQSPGGVSTNLTLWIKAGTGTSTTANGSPLDTWTYANDGSKSFSAVGLGGVRPSYASNAINFQPAALFSGGQLMDGPIGADAPITAGNDEYTIFAVWNSNISGTAPQRVWSQRSTGAGSGDGGGLWIYNGLYGDQPELPDFIQGVIRGYTIPPAINSWNISQISLFNLATNDLQVTDQGNLGSAPAVGHTYSNDPSYTPANDGAAQRNITNMINRLGARNDVTDEPFNGSLAELVVYDRAITAVEQARIFSYFAAKYGVPIAGVDLSSSSGISFWNHALSPAYNNNIFGIGTDNGSGLSITRSNSTTNSATPQQANIVLSSASALSDGSFVMIGNDNGLLTVSNNNLPAAAGTSLRIGRQWKVQNTGTPSPVSLAFDVNGISSSTAIADYRLVVDMDGNGDFTDGTQVYYGPTNVTAGVVNFDAIDLSGSPVLALITAADASTPLPVTWESFTSVVKGDDVVLNWKVSNITGAHIYEVEYAENGKDFTSIGAVSNVANVYNYSFVHNNVPAGTHAYRINEIDFDGKSIYSKISQVTIKSADLGIRILGNPVTNDNAILEVTAAQTVGKATIDLYTLGGVRISSRMQVLGAGSNIVNIPMSGLPASGYIIKVTANGSVYTARLSKI